MSLSEMQVRKAKEREKAYSMADGGGLYLWVTPTGGKLWRWSYRFDRKEKLMAFGRYPDVSLSKARELHRDARVLLASGIDPMAKRKEEKTLTRLRRRTPSRLSRCSGTNIGKQERALVTLIT